MRPLNELCFFGIRFPMQSPKHVEVNVYLSGQLGLLSSFSSGLEQVAFSWEASSSTGHHYI